MPLCLHCKNSLGKRKRFEITSKNANAKGKYCLEPVECIKAWIEDKKNGLPKQKEVKRKADDKAMRDKLKKPTQLEDEAKTVFQKWVRLRDAEHNCVSCGSPTSNPHWDGGHYRKAELYSGSIFDERNCHKQCRKCNYYENGNEASYRMGLVARYGEGFVLSLESDANQFKEFRYSRDDYKALKRKYQIKIKNVDFGCPTKYVFDAENLCKTHSQI